MTRLFASLVGCVGVAAGATAQTFDLLYSTDDTTFQTSNPGFSGSITLTDGALAGNPDGFFSIGDGVESLTVTVFGETYTEADFSFVFASAINGVLVGIDASFFAFDSTTFESISVDILAGDDIFPTTIGYLNDATGDEIDNGIITIVPAPGAGMLLCAGGVLAFRNRRP
ncbi:MAG: hypothetical protein AAGI30_11500 [Planctomycetota bacterium]